MTLHSIKTGFSSTLLIPGLIFLLVNTSTSHMFYHVNTYKMVLVILGLTCWAIRNLPFFPSPIDDRIPWKIWLFLAIPLLATFPGLIWHQWNFNYNFRYELATNLALFLWVVYLYRSVHQENELTLFIFFIGVAVIYNGCWSLLEKTGFHPLAWQEPVQMVMATFGHRNYFSGFLIVLLPILLVFSIPEKILDSPITDHFRGYSATRLFFTVAFLLGSVSLFLAQTRAAIAAFAISLALVGFLYVHFFAPRHWRKRVLILYGIGFLVAVCLMTVIALNPEWFKGSRFTQLFTLRGWVGRLLAWETAVSSIKASPLAGFGLGSSYNLFFSFVDPDASLFHHEHSYNHVHSEILEYLQESGLIGLIAFLVFWAWLIYLLIRRLRNSESSNLQIKLAIGISGGFLAYHIHSCFSVAPRMMVMKLPLFTLIALTLILNKSCSRADRPERNAPSLRSRALSGLPTLGTLLIIWIIFLPWAAGQYHFVRIQNERASYLQIAKMERLVSLAPDIYALDELSRQQIEYKRADALKKTLHRIEQIIPHYRDLGYKKALQAVMSGDPEKAKQLGLAFQQRDRYHLPGIDLLLNLSVATNDLPEFKKQLALFIRKHVFDHRLIESLTATDVQIQFLPLEEPLKVVSQPGKLTFQWSEKLVDLLFETARKNRFQEPLATEKQKYGIFLAQLLAKSPYFQLTLQDPYQNERRSILDLAKEYQSLDEAWALREKHLQRENRAELQRTLPQKRRDIYLRQLQTLAMLRQQYQARLDRFAEQLREKTDWDLYSRKQKFIKVFVYRFNAVIFPAGS
ncbi:O-antigen ligase family protein [bacterium]|nr:O-antigen ligase family protein [bacterium]